MESTQEMLTVFLRDSGIKEIHLNLQHTWKDPLLFRSKIKSLSYQHERSNKDWSHRRDREQSRLRTLLGLEKLDHHKLFDEISSRYCHKKPLPCNQQTGECMTESDYKKVQEIEAHLNFEKHRYEDASILHSGKLLEEILPNLRDQTKKMHVYSGHDTTLSALAGYFGIKDFGWPSYASNMILEIWKTGKTRTLRVVYNGRVSAYMPLDDFVEQAEMDIIRAKEANERKKW